MLIQNMRNIGNIEKPEKDGHIGKPEKDGNIGKPEKDMCSECREIDWQSWHGIINPW
jgi:hypothetical protein